MTNFINFQIFFHHRNGYHFDTALLLSIFLGMFGIDRFYLGYPAIGLLKFCTFGFMFLGQLVDVILIATQMVGPADGSAYIISYYGPVLSVIRRDNTTKIVQSLYNVQQQCAKQKENVKKNANEKHKTIQFIHLKSRNLFVEKKK